MPRTPSRRISPAPISPFHPRGSPTISAIPISSCSTLVTRRSEEHTSELQSQSNLVCRLLLEKKKTTTTAEANEMLGRIYTFNGWQAVNCYCGSQTGPSLPLQYFAERRADVQAVTGRVSARDSAARRMCTADLCGWARVLQQDYANSKHKPADAARLSQDQDLVNPFHLVHLATLAPHPSFFFFK